MKTGGSNYWKIGGDSASPPLGAFHLLRDQATSELQSMFEHGQRKITLLCSFSPLNFPAGQKDHIWGHVISSAGGVMYPQHQQNLVDLLGVIREIGYNGLHFRFHPCGTAADVNWPDTNGDGQPDWNGSQFTENANFTLYVRGVVEANRGTLPVIYDLGLEYANDRLATSTTHELNCRQLWKRYTDAFGPNDSCGFTIIHGAKGLGLMLQKFKTAKLPYPSHYCFDIYDDHCAVLTACVPVLTQYGEQAKPIYLQETNYNDAVSYTSIKELIAQTDLNFQYIFQWDVIRDQDKHYFPDIYPKRYDNYLVEV